ncbi:MAG TPA: DUF5329 family protein [Candidatus Krumholzibacterium sp.]|nr:DUF5329 family protein [Candidatus Krumholzibacterium sp.]
MQKTNHTYVAVLALTLLIIAGVLASPAPRAEEGGFTDEAEAHAIYDRIFEVFRTEQTLYLESEYSYGTKDMTLGHVRYRIWLKKGDLARLEIRGLEGGPACDVVLDGRQFWIYWPEGGPYMSWMDPEEYEKTKMKMYQRKPVTPGRHSISHTFNDTWVGVSMTIFQFSSFHGYTDAMMEYLDGVRGLGTETVDGEVCDVIEVSFMEGQRIRKYWVSRENHLPVRLEQTVHASYDILYQETWSGVQTGVAMDDGLFAWKPGEDWVEVHQPKPEEGLLQPGTEAPPFEATLRGGGRFNLSSERGNVVWLIFWRVGCPPCRVEMPHLEEMHRKYSDRGLRIMGFNCFDASDIAQEFLDEYKATYPSVLDSSRTAQAVFFDDYQKIRGMSAVPLNYIIGRDGRIVEGWYGFDEETHGDENWLLEILDGKATGTQKVYGEEELGAVVEHLLKFVEEAGCVFIRNGREYDSRDAAKHIRRKYNHYRKEIKTPGDFIRLSATKSEMSGKPYMVRLAGGKEIPCARWLEQELARYERKDG